MMPASVEDTRTFVRYAGWVAFPLIVLLAWQDDVLRDALSSTVYWIVLLSLLFVLLLAAFIDFQILREKRQEKS